MKVKDLAGMLNDVQRRINGFDIKKLIDGVNDGTVDKDRAKKFVDDVYNLEEDLIIMDCTKDNKW